MGEMKSTREMADEGKAKYGTLTNETKSKRVSYKGQMITLLWSDKPTPHWGVSGDKSLAKYGTDAEALDAAKKAIDAGTLSNAVAVATENYAGHKIELFDFLKQGPRGVEKGSFYKVLIDGRSASMQANLYLSHGTANALAYVKKFIDAGMRD